MSIFLLFFILVIFYIIIFFAAVEIGKLESIKKSPYYVRYVKKGTMMPLKQFSSKQEATKWIANFKLKHQGSYDEEDYWVDLIFKSNKIIFDSNKKD